MKVKKQFKDFKNWAMNLRQKDMEMLFFTVGLAILLSVLMQLLAAAHTFVMIGCALLVLSVVLREDKPCTRTYV